MTTRCRMKLRIWWYLIREWHRMAQLAPFIHLITTHQRYRQSTNPITHSTGQSRRMIKHVLLITKRWSKVINQTMNWLSNKRSFQDQICRSVVWLLQVSVFNQTNDPLIVMDHSIRFLIHLTSIIRKRFMITIQPRHFYSIQTNQTIWVNCTKYCIKGTTLLWFFSFAQSFFARENLPIILLKWQHGSTVRWLARSHFWFLLTNLVRIVEMC